MRFNLGVIKVPHEKLKPNLLPLVAIPKHFGVSSNGNKVAFSF
jgi:hypothetical protein